MVRKEKDKTVTDRSYSTIIVTNTVRYGHEYVVTLTEFDSHAISGY